MKFEISKFKHDYTQQIINIWNAELFHDQISPKRFNDEIVSDANFQNNLFLVALYDDEVIGFIYAITRLVPYLSRGLESGKGWINIMAVKHSFQNKGVGTTLLKTVESTLSLMDVKDITLCAYSPNYFTPGIDVKYEKALHFFESNNYTLNQDAVSMYRNLYNYTMSNHYTNLIKAYAEDGFKFSMFNQNHTNELLDFVEENFGGGWTLAINRLINQHKAEESIIVARFNNNIVGFCMRGLDGSESRYGPVGVSNTMRGKGLGGIMTELLFQSMVERKIFTTYFLWTTGSNIDFYCRHGFKTFRHYKMSAKKL